MGRKTVKTSRRELARQERDKNVKRMQEYAAYDEPAPTAQAIPKLEPMNQNQKRAMAALAADTPVVFLAGSAGTGKSMIAAHRAACLLKSKKINKIWLARPNVVVGKSIGLLPGSVEEKLLPYFLQTLSHLERFLGKGFLKYCLEKKVIEMVPCEYLRGMSFENCFVLIEESQGLQPHEFEMLLTRMGEGCTMVYTGDQAQHDLRGESGLKTITELLDRMLQTHPEYLDREDIDSLDDGYCVIRFTPDDVVRSGLTKAFVKIFFHNSHT